MRSFQFRLRRLLPVFVIAGVVGIGVIPGTSKSHASDTVRVAQSVSGPASWYGGKFHGRRTANGERFNKNELTAAHRSLPFGTRVRVTNQRNGRSVVVRINDRGPFVGNRVIDLSRAAAEAVGMLRSGVAPVQLDILM
jgi:rare lipoprotein A